MQERTEWIPVTFRGKLAEIAAQYLTKGQMVYVAGEFRTRKWQDQNGNDRYSTEVVVDGFGGQMQMLSPKGQNSQGSSAQNGQGGKSGGYAPPIDQDVPF